MSTLFQVHVPRKPRPLTKLEKYIEFVFAEPSALILERSKKYFLSNKFRLLEETENYLRFEGGSARQSRLDFDALRWKSHIVIQVRENGIQAFVEIYHDQPIVSYEEHNLWDVFLKNYRDSVLEDIDLNYLNDRERLPLKSKKVMMNLIFSILFVFLLLLLYGVIQLVGELVTWAVHG